MKNKSSLLPIERTAAELQMKIASNPFHAAEGIELRKEDGGDDVITCVGYICGPEETVIYRRKESRRDLFVRDKLWFFYGWLLKPRSFKHDYRELQRIPASQFTENMFLDVARSEFSGKGEDTLRPTIGDNQFVLLKDSILEERRPSYHVKLQPQETELVGKWIAEDDEARRDATCDRIEQLTKTYLKQVAVSKELGAWETLFEDPADGRFWERTYLQSNLHGGGPPSLRCISTEEAWSKYGDALSDS